MQVIKKAQIFADQEYKDNIKQMIKKSRVIESDIQAEEEMRRKHKEDVIRKEKELAQKLGQNVHDRMTHP